MLLAPECLTGQERQDARPRVRGRWRLRIYFCAVSVQCCVVSDRSEATLFPSEQQMPLSGAVGVYAACGAHTVVVSAHKH